MRPRTPLGVVTGAAIVASIAGITVAITSLTAPVAAPSPSDPDILMAQADDHLPSQTATDWTTYADHVVVVNAVEEQSTPPTQQELDRGEGTISRVVTLAITEVLWSRTDAPEPAPATWQYSALGWQFKDGDVESAIKMAMLDHPRVEVGHQYVMAIRWEGAQCSEDGEIAPAQWRGLGEGSEIPYDDGILGQGESEGQTRSADQFAADSMSTEGLEEQLAGQSAGALVAALDEASPDSAAQAQMEASEAETACS